MTTATNKNSSNDNSEKELKTIQDNWIKFTGLVNKLSDDHSRLHLTSLCEAEKDRLAVAPCSTRLEYHGAYLGGLVQNNLQVVKLMSELNKAYEAKLTTDTIITLGLFHNLGKIGNETQDLYLTQDSDWHRKRGMMFEFNSDLNRIPVPTRSLFWLNKFGIRLTEEEVYAITSLNNIQGSETTSFGEFFNAPLSAVILQNAVRVVAIKGSNKTSVCD